MPRCCLTSSFGIAILLASCGGIERADVDGGFDVSGDQVTTVDSPALDSNVADTPLETGPDTLWYPDCDCDDYAAREAPIFGPQEARPAVTALACSRGLVRGCQNGGWTIRAPSPPNIDCADSNENVNPSVTTPSEQPFEGDSFDWNCDGVEQSFGRMCTSDCQADNESDCIGGSGGDCWFTLPACGAMSSSYIERCDWIRDPNTPQDTGSCSPVGAAGPRLRCL